MEGKGEAREMRGGEEKGHGLAPGNNWAFWCGDSVAALQGPKVLRVLAL